jgi:hypothetical protein
MIWHGKNNEHMVTIRMNVLGDAADEVADVLLELACNGSPLRRVGLTDGGDDNCAYGPRFCRSDLTTGRCGGA